MHVDIGSYPLMSLKQAHDETQRLRATPLETPSSKGTQRKRVIGPHATKPPMNLAGFCIVPQRPWTFICPMPC